MLNNLLEKMGFYPTSQTTKHTKYKSPFNPTEKTPSFFTFQGTNGTNWKDYASGEGGDIYKFLMLFHKISFIQAKKILEDIGDIKKHNDNIQMLQKASTKIPLDNKEPYYKIKSIKKLEDNKPLMQYLNKRGISVITISKVSLDAIYYQMNNKNYFAIGFKNDNEGYEIRNAYFKGNLKNKALTTILNNSKQIKVFEGFIDYLSYLEITQNGIISDYLILNSVSLINKALEYLQGNYDLIELYLDNDKAGNETTQKIKKNISSKIIDKRSYYKEHKDLNEYLINIQERTNIK